MLGSSVSLYSATTGRLELKPVGTKGMAQWPHPLKNVDAMGENMHFQIESDVPSTGAALRGALYCDCW